MSVLHRVAGAVILASAQEVRRCKNLQEINSFRKWYIYSLMTFWLMDRSLHDPTYVQPPNCSYVLYLGSCKILSINRRCYFRDPPNQLCRRSACVLAWPPRLALFSGGPADSSWVLPFASRNVHCSGVGLIIIPRR